MNSEANRLATFASWPSHFPVDVRRLARGGFFANSTRGERAAECHWCRQCIDDWHYGDQVRFVGISIRLKRRYKVA